MRELLCLAYALGESHEIEERWTNVTTELPSVFSEDFCNLLNNGLSFDSNEIIIARGDN